MILEHPWIGWDKEKIQNLLIAELWGQQGGFGIQSVCVEEIEICPECGGAGAVSGTEAVHGCDGTEEMCLRVCPIPQETMEQCQRCETTGWVTKEFFGTNNPIRGEKDEDMPF
jgi:hypothetical protein